MEFKSCWGRIKEATALRTLEQLAEVVGTTQSNVSKKKNKGEFPPDWAYMVGRKYGLFTEWIMTGEGPKKISELRQEKSETRKINCEFLYEVDEWLTEATYDEPFRKDWFIANLIDFFPLFKEWKKRKNCARNNGQYSSHDKVA